MTKPGCFSLLQICYSYPMSIEGESQESPDSLVQQIPQFWPFGNCITITRGQVSVFWKVNLLVFWNISKVKWIIFVSGWFAVGFLTCIISAGRVDRQVKVYLVQKEDRVFMAQSPVKTFSVAWTETPSFLDSLLS